MNAPALAPVVAHPAIRGTKADRAAVAEALGLDDVAGLLGGASGLAASETWESRR